MFNLENKSLKALAERQNALAGKLHLGKSFQQEWDDIASFLNIKGWTEKAKQIQEEQSRQFIAACPAISERVKQFA